MGTNSLAASRALITAAGVDGSLTAASCGILLGADLGAQIQAGLGIDVNDVQASSVTLVALLIDDSGSIRFGSNAQLVRDGHNLVLDSLGRSKQKDGVLVHTRYLNGTVLYPYVPLDQVVRMTSQNYDPMGGTPLYDETGATLATVVAKQQEFITNGVPARGVTVIITDGADEGSRKLTAAKLRPIVQDLLKTEQHIVAGMGIDDGGRTDFRKVFRDMGIPDEWILTPGSNESDIRKAFLMVSQSAVRASQAASISSVGGFGAP